MSNYKAVIDFSSYAGPALVTVAQNIHEHLNSLASTYPDIPVPASELLPLISTLSAALIARENNGKNEIIAYNIARHELEVALNADGAYLNGKAGGDVEILIGTGYPYYEIKRGSLPNPPLAPTNVVLRHGGVSGEIIARYHPDRPSSANEVQLNPGDPNVAAGWTFAGIFSGGKATLGGQTPGAVVWVRVRTVGKGGAMGAWSDPAQIRVL